MASTPRAPPAAIVDARIAVGNASSSAASGSTAAPTTVWSSVRVANAAGGFVWLVPVRASSAVDRAPDAWFEALEAATAPRILPPSAGLACAVPRGVEVAGDLAPRHGVEPIDTTVVRRAGDLAGHLAAWGFSLDPALGARIGAAFADGGGLVAMTFAGATDVVTTPTLRVVGDEAKALPMVLTHAGVAPVRVTAFGLSRGRVAFGEADALTIDGRAVAWGKDGLSSYVAVRDAALAWAEAHGGALFVEAASPTALLGGARAASPDAGVTVPDVLGAYMTLAAGASTMEDGGRADAAPCIAAARDAVRMHPGASVATPCARGEIASAACTEHVGAGEIAPGAFRCGDADDVAFALGGAPPASIWITRAVGLVPAETFGVDVALRADPGPARDPVLTADSYSVVCVAQEAGASTGGGASSGGQSSGSSGSGNGSGGAGPGDSLSPGYSDPAPVPGIVIGAGDTEGCGGSSASSDTSETSDDSCGGGPSGEGTSSDGYAADAGEDASADETSSGDACASDSTDDTASDDCGSNDGTASSGEPSDGNDSCASDDSSGTSSDDSCSGSGDDSSGSDDSCSSPSPDATPARAKVAQAAPKAARQHARAAKKPRSPVSRAVLGFALLLAPLRRRMRRA